MQQVMIFQMGEENYGLTISQIREIVELTPLTPVPKTPTWVEGILNHHGRVVTVLNLSSFFDLPSLEGNILNRIAVLDARSADIGVLLGTTLEVISQWEASAEGLKDTEFVRGKYISKVLSSKGRVINLIDIEKLVSDLDNYFV